MIYLLHDHRTIAVSIELWRILQRHAVEIFQKVGVPERNNVRNLKRSRNNGIPEIFVVAQFILQLSMRYHIQNRLECFAFRV
jgi:hypothetical protein